MWAKSLEEWLAHAKSCVCANWKEMDRHLFCGRHDSESSGAGGGRQTRSLLREGGDQETARAGLLPHVISASPQHDPGGAFPAQFNTGGHTGWGGGGLAQQHTDSRLKWLRNQCS